MIAVYNREVRREKRKKNITRERERDDTSYSIMVETSEQLV
jgi:hypothetical protein